MVKQSAQAKEIIGFYIYLNVFKGLVAFVLTQGLLVELMRNMATGLGKFSYVPLQALVIAGVL